MPITIEVKLSPEEAASPTDIKTCVAREAGLIMAELRIRCEPSAQRGGIVRVEGGEQGAIEGGDRTEGSG